MREKSNYREQLSRLDDLYPGREVLTVDETAGLLGVHRQTLIDNRRKFPLKKLGRRWLAPKTEVARWLS